MGSNKANRGHNMGERTNVLYIKALAAESGSVHHVAHHMMV